MGFQRLCSAPAACVLLGFTAWLSGPASAAAPPASAALSTLYSFGAAGSSASGVVGASPLGLTAGTGGVLYGLTQSGGANGDGTVFAFQPSGTATALYALGDSDGSAGSLTVSAAGLLLGTEPNGGANSSGAVFHLAPDGTGFTTLYSFSAADSNGINSDGVSPTGSLLEGSGGRLYGETQFGGPYGQGGVYQINADGSGFAVLHSFGADSGDGEYPTGGLVAGPDGTLYGVTGFGGTGNSGTVFTLKPDGSGYAVLHQFASVGTAQVNADGAVPAAALMLGTDDALYGVTVIGGSGGSGVVFRLGTDGTGFTVLHTFSATDGQNTNSDGAFPITALVKDRAGNCYGTTVSGGNAGHGTLFRLSAAGSQFATLYSFQSGDGTEAALTEGSNGRVYGITLDGGANAAGSLFEVCTDNTTHILWDNASGAASVWNYDTATGAFSHQEYGPYAGWTASGVADGPDDLTRVLWNNASGAMSLWSLDNLTGVYTQNSFGPYAGWTAKSVSVGPDNATHILWDNASGAASVWNYDTATGAFSHQEYGPYAGWTASGVADGPDDLTRVLWNNASGAMSLWSLDNLTGVYTQNSFGPYAGWTAKSVSVGPDNTTHILWDNASGAASVWNYSTATGAYTQNTYGPYSGWTAAAVADGPDGLTRVLWNNASGAMSLWSLDNLTGVYTQNSFGPYAGWTAKGVSAGP